MIKKYIITALVSLVLLASLFYFVDLNKKDFTGFVAYVVPENKILFESVNNHVGNYFCLSDGKIYGTFEFKIINNSFLPADDYIGLVVFNRSSDGKFNYSSSNYVLLSNFMSNTTPAIGPFIQANLESETFGRNGPTNVYNSTDSIILSQTYKVDLGLYSLNLPPEGNYEYVVNLSQNSNGGGEHLKVLDGSFSVINRNCALGVNNVNLEVVGGGNLYVDKNVNCSASVDGRFYGDFSKSPDKINFSLEWYNGSSFFNHKTLVGGDSGVSCDLKNSCSAIFSFSASHFNKWRCSVGISNVVDSIIKFSNNISMNNSAPILTYNIPNKSFDGGAKENFFNLNEYFSDKDSGSLTYSISGGSKIKLYVKSDGKVNISAPVTEGLVENFNALANDGLNKTLSNVFSIKITNETSNQFLSNNSNLSTCTANWSVGDFGECGPDGIKTRIVVDLNGCGDESGKPAESESCTYEASEQLSEQQPLQQQPVVGKEEKESIFKNKFVLTGIILGLFFLTLVAILIIDKARKGKNIIKSKIEPAKNVQPSFAAEPSVRQAGGEEGVVNIGELVKYIQDMMAKGGGEAGIKERLISAGWSKRDVDEAFNFVKLKKFVDEMLKRGESRENIIKILKTRGWKEEYINRVFEK